MWSNEPTAHMSAFSKHAPSGILVGIALMLSTACKSDTTGTNTTNTPSGIVASMQVVSGQGQSATESTELPNPLVVKVVDSLGKAVSGQLVNFRVVAGGGSMFAGASITNAQGLAQDRWTLGPATADSQVAEARAVDNNTGAPIVFARFLAVAVALATPALAVSAGEFHTCALKQDGAASCWGYNPYGAIGDGTTTDRSTPTAVMGGLTFATINVSGRHSCATTASNAGYCWGENDDGEVGDGTQANRVIPTSIHGPSFFSLAAGDYNHTCGLAGDSTAYCWGNLSVINYGLTPTNVTTIKFVTISSGGEHVCALTSAGAACCWGESQSGEIGDSTIGTSYKPPTTVHGGLQFSRIAAGNGHTCALDRTGGLYCWGYGTTLTPQQVASPVQFTELTSGWYHNCALTSDGTAYCWGDNQYGELGDSTNTNQPTPVRVKGNHVFREISGGARHTCAIDDHSAVYCWGSNQFGELGDGTQLDRLVPTAARPLAGS